MRSQLVAAIAIALTSRSLHAQADSSSSPYSCGDRAAGPRVTIGTESSARTSSVVDTTIVLNIDSRTWTHDSASAGVGFGANGAAGSQSGRWRVCTGATVSLGHVSTSLTGVHGLIHLRIDPNALAALGHASSTIAPPTAPSRR